MKSLKRIILIMFSVVMLLCMSTSVFAAASPAKKNFNASLAKKAVTYNGKVQKPKVVVTDSKGKKISAKYYTVSAKEEYKNAGTYTVTIKGKGKYAGTVKKLTYKIKQSTQTVKVTSKVSVKASKKKTQAVKFTVQKKTGKVTYQTNNKKIIVKNGKIYVKKGLKKGNYKVKVTVASKNYKTVSKYIRVTVK